ncbi:MAG: chemotaxis protein CheB, partial [Planctomycetota bacterium]
MRDLRASAESETVPIVGIGASAGGLKSIELMLDNLPNGTGLAFVIIQHLSPDFRSLMPEILARHTEMDVCLATQESTIEANHVYVIPPGKELRCFGHTLAITDLPSGLSRPIDTFFTSLAKNSGVPCAGIILSGTGSDGTLGIEAIHQNGGFTIVETGDSAEFDGMPLSAERTGCVDLVLPPEKIPDALECFNGKPKALANCSQRESGLQGMELIFALLEKQFGLQFEHYKPSTITRRVGRRQQFKEFQSIIEYAEYLRDDFSELDNLFHDLLIGVTKFFRDEQAFNILENSLREKLVQLPEDEPFRAWSIGCATGEEPYSLAMILSDLMQQLDRRFVVKIFATDVHQRSLEAAAKGVFDAEAVEFVSASRKARYFDELEDGSFCVKPFLRRMVVFAQHDAIEDASFTRLQLVSCRNVLIYFGSSAQESALAAIHFSLVKHGILFLGPSESLGNLETEYVPLERQWRIYEKMTDRSGLNVRVKRIRNVDSAA